MDEKEEIFFLHFCDLLSSLICKKVILQNNLPHLALMRDKRTKDSDIESHYSYFIIRERGENVTGNMDYYRIKWGKGKEKSEKKGESPSADAEGLGLVGSLIGQLQNFHSIGKDKDNLQKAKKIHVICYYRSNNTQICI